MMDYAPSVLISSVSPQAPHVHVSILPPSAPNGPGSFRDAVRRDAGSPHALHSFPAAARGFASKAARRFSSASIRPGAARIFFHSSQRSSAARISVRTDNGLS